MCLFTCAYSHVPIHTQGWCAFGVTCKYNHPESMGMNLMGPSALATMGSTLPYMAPSMINPAAFRSTPPLLLQRPQMQAPKGLQPLVQPRGVHHHHQLQQQLAHQQQQQQQQQEQAMYWAVAQDPEDVFTQNLANQLMQGMPVAAPTPTMSPSSYMQPVLVPMPSFQQVPGNQQLLCSPSNMMALGSGSSALNPAARYSGGGQSTALAHQSLLQPMYAQGSGLPSPWTDNYDTAMLGEAHYLRRPS